jgi:hypothetical protein
MIDMTTTFGPSLSYAIPLEDFSQLSDDAFALSWKERFNITRIQMIPDIARWMKVLRYFAPRRLEDHWQDQFGMPLPKLADSEGLSVAIYNVCQPMIEVYGSLLAGQKPLPFFLDVKPSDSKIRSEMFRADAQEKLILQQIESQRIPEHFLDFCVSVMLFGIGWAYTYIEPRSRMLQTQTVSWPGDVLPQWGSNRYGRGADALESVILTENLPIDTAMRKYPGTEFQIGFQDIGFRPDSAMQMLVPSGMTQLLKVWYRWADYEQGKEDEAEERIGYAEIAHTGTKDHAPTVLYRMDDTGYPDIPVRWASRFQTPGEPPHKAAGVLDNVIGINTEYNERLSAFSDLLMKFVYPKLKGKNYNVNTLPRLSPRQNIVPMGLNQDLSLIQDIIQGGQAYFDSFLNRIEHYMLMSGGLSSIMMGTLPPGETSGEALNNLLHSSIARLEVVRTPIQWAWLSMFQELWIPLLYKYGTYTVKDMLTGKSKKTNLKEIFDTFAGFVWTWPDVTPRDAIRVIQTTMDLVNAGMLSKESGMSRVRIGSPVDEMEKIRQEYMDPVISAEKVRMTKMVEMMSAPQSQAQTGGGVKISLSGMLSPEEIQEAAQLAGVGGAAPTTQPSGQPGGGMDKMNAQVKNDNVKAKAAGTPTKTESQNERPVRRGSSENAAQGVRGGSSGGANTQGGPM